MGEWRRLRRVARPRRRARRRAPRQGQRQRQLRGPRPRQRARLSRPAVHLADGRDLHRRPDAGPPHRRLGVVERDLRRRLLAARKPRPSREVEVKWKGDARARAQAQAHFSNAHQAMNGLGLCMFTMLTGTAAVARAGQHRHRLGHRRARAVMRAGERIQNLRAAFNWREGLAPGRLHRAPAHDGRRRRQPHRRGRSRASASRCRSCATTTTGTCTGTPRTGRVTKRSRAGAGHRRAARRVRRVTRCGSASARTRSRSTC